MNYDSFTSVFRGFQNLIDFTLSVENHVKRRTNLMLCTIWYHFYGLKSVKNTHGGILHLVKLRGSSFHLWCGHCFGILTVHNQLFLMNVNYANLDLTDCWSFGS